MSTTSDTLGTSRHCKPQAPRCICGKIGETRRTWYLVLPSSYWRKDQQFWARLDGVLMAYRQTDSDTKCGSLSPHVRWGVTCPLCTQENSLGLFPKRFVFLTSRANVSVHLFWNNSRSCDYARRDLTTRSLQNGVSFMLINDTSLIAWVKVVYVASYGWFFSPHISQNRSGYVTSGCCFTPTDSARLSKMRVAIWQALTYSVGVKSSNWWNRREQTRDREHFCLLQLPVVGAALFTSVCRVLPSRNSGMLGCVKCVFGGCVFQKGEQFIIDVCILEQKTMSVLFI